ncbi:MAG TPA: hypothetical protein VN903_11670 [Polyangia bacterium]|nr:hypothetical protein [Polyangia bacterium]
MTQPESGNDAPQPFKLNEREVADLRAAGRWARLAGCVGGVGMVLMALLLLDVGVKNPRALTTSLAGDSVLQLVSIVVSALGCLGGVALVWAYGRNVAAFFAGGDIALPRAFRRIRQFFILSTCVLAVTSVLGLLAGI